MRFDILTIFPEFFDGPLRCGVLARALDTGLLQVQCHALRAFTQDKHQTVDDRPFGGGEGMVLKPEPIYRAVESLGVAEKSVRDLARERVVLLCGRYEGVDERVNDCIADLELSIGDYVLTGGELAAAVVVDAVARLLPGVLGNEDSSRFESFSAKELPEASAAAAAGEISVETAAPRSTCDSGGLLDYPHYTRPAEFRGERVPEVLSSGNHEQIRRWRRRKSLEKTLRNRPDLLVASALSKEDQAILREIQKESIQKTHKQETQRPNSV